MIAGLIRRDTGASAAGSDAGAQIPYPAEERKADVRHGRLDGRRRIPSYTQVSDRIAADGWFTTAYSEELQEVGTTRVHHERHAYQRQVEPKRQRVAGLRKRLTAAVADIERTEEALRLTATELTADEMVPCNPQETQRGIDFIRSRRRSMRGRQARQARERIEALTGEADDLRRQIAETCEEMEQDFERAKVRGRLQAAQVELRVATYWRALTQTHPEGRQLTVVLPLVRLALPAWLDEPAPEPTDEAPDDATDDHDPSAGPAEG
jgi:hypothetical protein